MPVAVTLEQATRRFLQEFIFAGSFLLFASFFVCLFKGFAMDSLRHLIPAPRSTA